MMFFVRLFYGCFQFGSFTIFFLLEKFVFNFCWDFDWSLFSLFLIKVFAIGFLLGFEDEIKYMNILVKI